ncbi:MAG: histidine phosphatase family protein [Polyangiaceae bacterium]|nr:histidine phosphatase family protein [Polyangiaceae bacterium]
MAFLRLIAFRHAPVPFAGLCYGRLNTSVPIPGSAVDTICAKLGSSTPNIIWSSDLSRCEVLARAVAVKVAARHLIDHRLTEIAFGRWEGRTWIDIEAVEPEALQSWYRNWETVGPPGGESARQLESRVRSWWESLDPAQLHVLVAHAGVIRALRVIVKGATWPDAMSVAVPYLADECFSAFVRST